MNTVNASVTLKKFGVSFQCLENATVKLICELKTLERVKLNETIALILGFDPRRQMMLKTNDIGVRPADIKLGIPAHMYVYCDLVEPQLVGDACAPLLKMVEIDLYGSPYRTHKTVQFHDPHYVPIMKSSFENVERGGRLRRSVFDPSGKGGGGACTTQ